MDEEHETTPLKPLLGRKTWLILVVIFVVIAVAVLYVYQAGDRKTILGNQPIPAGQAYAGPVALNVPVRGAAPAPAARGLGPTIPSSGATVQCPLCQTEGLPVCSACGAVMQPIDQGAAHGLFVCPRCGVVGLPLCPRCGAHMTSPGQAGHQPVDFPPGQFQCPACGATGLPVLGPGGVPTCPNCGARMQVR